MYKPSEIYISTSNVNIRKGLDGFVSIVEQQFKLNPMSSAMFVFHNRHCDKIKILFWGSDGFCLLYNCHSEMLRHYRQYADQAGYCRFGFQLGYSKAYDCYEGYFANGYAD